MNSASRTDSLAPGTRVTIYGAPGVVVRVFGTDIWVSLDNEGSRVDIWQACQVEPVAS